MSKKTKGLIILLISYILAYVIGLTSFILLKDYVPVIYNILIADIISTIFIWLVGVVFKTASVYDPYWSVQTVLIYFSLQIGYNNFNVGNVLLLIIILLWSIRLTWNFCYGFSDLSYIDWRYKKIKEKTKSLYQIVSLLGIHLVPTLIVYCASIPAFIYVIEGYDFNVFNILGYIVMILAISLEIISDLNMITFKKIRKSRNQIIDIGLWKYSRHPNYLGEILFWYGLALVLISSNIGLYYYIYGAILNNLLFLFISIPLAEGHLSTYKENYDEYKKNTGMLLPKIKKAL